MTTKPKLTLKTWAELDQAASPGPYVSVLINEDYDNPEDMSKASAFVSAPEMIAESDGDFLNKLTCDFLAASRQAPTRILAALRVFIKNEEQDAKPHTLASENAESYEAYEAGACGVLRRLGRLIETLDLSAPAEEKSK